MNVYVRSHRHSQSDKKFFSRQKEGHPASTTLLSLARDYIGAIAFDGLDGRDGEKSTRVEEMKGGTDLCLPGDKPQAGHDTGFTEEHFSAC